MYFYLLIRIHFHFSTVLAVREALLIDENKYGTHNFESWSYMKGNSSKLSKQLTLLLLQGARGKRILAPLFLNDNLCDAFLEHLK